MTNEQQTKEVIHDVLERAKFLGPTADVGALVEVAYGNLRDRNLLNLPPIPIYRQNELMHSLGTASERAE